MFFLMKLRARLQPMGRSWLARCREQGWTKDTKLPRGHVSPLWRKRFPLRDYEALKQRLLAVAGQAVCLHQEEDLPQLLSRGEFYRGYNSRMMKGEAGRCHANSSRLWERNSSKLRIVTGYALSRDGAWRQHTWCVDKDDKVIETTEKRVLYFGFPMTRAEAEEFADNNW